MTDEKQITGHDEPIIVKYVERAPTGIETKHLSRYAIGAVLRGELHLYDGDKRRTMRKGELFLLSIGNHYTESVPDQNAPFELILLYYTPSDLQRILMHLTVTYGVVVANHHTCEECRRGNVVAGAASVPLQNFFQATNNYLKEGEFVRCETAENIKMTELVYLIVSGKEGCLKSRLLSSVDREQSSFEQTIYEHLFTQVSIEELAAKTNRSLTAFKKEFRRHFALPPHKWFISQRLNHARLQLIATQKSISEIGVECSFPNTSHFIKLYKRAYGLTPVAYRNRRRRINSDHRQGATIYAEAE